MYITKDSGLIWFAFRIVSELYLNKLEISDDKYWSICLHNPLFLLCTCCKNLVMPVFLDFAEDKKKPLFLVKCQMVK